MRRISLFLSPLAVLLFSSATVHAQAAQGVAAPSSPPPPAPPAPPPPPPATAAPPAPQPTTTPWQPGMPTPPGYHVEDRPRQGLVIAGAIVAGIPYFFSVMAATAANENNASGWLFVPVMGPWMTMGQRSYSCNDSGNQSTSQSLQCVGDIFVVMGLIADGVMQAAGATLLIVGLAAGKPTLVRDEQAVHVTPMHVGTGYGAGLVGAF